MKIIEIIPALASGGGERFVVDLCNELCLEHDVTLLVLHPLKGVCAFYLPQVSDRVKVVCLKKKKGVDFGIFWRIHKFIKAERPDVVHTHLRAITYSFLPMAFHVHGYHTVHNDASKEAADKISCFIRRLLFKSGRVTPITISEDSHRSFVEFYGMDAPLINNGRDIPSDLKVSENVKIEIAGYKRDTDTRIIIQLAHLDDVKRQELMARVAHRLYDEGYNFAVLFIGHSYNERYKQRVEKVIPPCCHILGPRQNPLEYLAEADAFGLCSRYEGLPISLIEAMGVGTIPICTPVGGIVNVVKDGENGFLSDDISEDSYYYALKRYLNTNNTKLAAIRSKVLLSYKPYSMKECARKYVSLFSIKLNHNEKCHTSI